MNLAKLFEMQRQLDEHIEKEHPRQEGEDRLAKKILALQVELGELANEWRGFKYWSNNQKPRIRAYDKCPCGTDYGSCDEYSCEDGLLTYNPLLEEYVDTLHFLLSIGLEIEASFRPYSKCKAGDVLNQLRMLYRSINEFDARSKRIEHRDGYYKEMFQDFLNLGEMLGFSWEEVEEAYIRKNAVNHERQNNGY